MISTRSPTVSGVNTAFKQHLVSLSAEPFQLFITGRTEDRSSQVNTIFTSVVEIKQNHSMRQKCIDQWVFYILGLHLYPIAIGLGAYGCQLWMNYRENYYAERDAIMRHYIQLHPDDFQPPGTKPF